MVFMPNPHNEQKSPSIYFLTGFLLLARFQNLLLNMLSKSVLSHNCTTNTINLFLSKVQGALKISVKGQSIKEVLT